MTIPMIFSRRWRLLHASNIGFPRDEEAGDIGWRGIRVEIILVEAVDKAWCHASKKGTARKRDRLMLPASVTVERLGVVKLRAVLGS
jgi:hypothetical protein